MSDMKVDQLITQMRMMSAQAQGISTSMPSIMGTPQAGSPAADFSNVLSHAMGKVNDLQNDASALKVKFENNEPDVNLVDVMLASQKAGIAFQGTVQVRNKLISAYQDVMNMQV